MVKSVDKIVKGLEKLVNQLDMCASLCVKKMGEQEGIKLRAQADWDVARNERDRAARIKTKLAELIE